MGVHSYWNHELSDMFTIDKTACVQNGEINNQHLFESFGLFSDEDAELVCSDIIERIETGKNVYEQVGEEFFSHREWNIMEWALATCSQYYYGDELLLYVLCHVFHRHAVVICKERYWCTFEPNESMDIYAVLDCCDLQFVYLQPGIFAKLRLKKHRITQRSPPEFPECTQCESPRNTEDNGSISANISLINHSLNPAKPVSGDDGDNKGGNKTTKGGNVPPQALHTSQNWQLMYHPHLQYSQHKTLFP